MIPINANQIPLLFVILFIFASLFDFDNGIPKSVKILIGFIQDP